MYCSFYIFGFQNVNQPNLLLPNLKNVFRNAVRNCSCSPVVPEESLAARQVRIAQLLYMSLALVGWFVGYLRKFRF